MPSASTLEGPGPPFICIPFMASPNRLSSRSPVREASSNEAFPTSFSMLLKEYYKMGSETVIDNFLSSTFFCDTKPRYIDISQPRYRELYQVHWARASIFYPQYFGSVQERISLNWIPKMVGQHNSCLKKGHVYCSWCTSCSSNLLSPFYVEFFGSLKSTS